MKIIETDNPILSLLEILETENSVIYFDAVMKPLDFRLEIEPPFTLNKYQSKTIPDIGFRNVLRYTKCKNPLKLIFDWTKDNKLGTTEYLSVKEKYEALKELNYEMVEVIIFVSKESPAGLKLDRSELTNFIELPEHTIFHKTKKLLSKEAREFGLEKPKGMLMVGFPGTGKTQSAKYLASILDRPLYKLDVANTYNRLVGESEKALSASLSFIETKEAVLFIDEVDKLFSQNSNPTSDTSQKLLSILLNWLTEDKECYVVMAANRVSNLPIEILRKGRLDSIVHCSLPNLETIKVFIDVYGDYLPNKNPKNYVGYSHAELYWACNKAKENTFLGVEQSIDITPLSVIRHDELKTITEWADRYKS